MLSLIKVLILEDQASKLNAAWLTGIDNESLAQN